MTNKLSRARIGDEPNPVDVHVGARVRMYRSLHGMSQEKLAEALGLTFQQVQKYETGYNRISASRLWDISQVLNTPIEMFYQDMTSQVSALSPRHVNNDNPQEVSPVLAQVTKLYNSDPMTRRETLSLVRAYYKIPNRALARKFFELIKLSAYSNEDAPEMDDEIEPETRTKRQK